jgi:hypothetical protein
MTFMPEVVQALRAITPLDLHGLEELVPRLYAKSLAGDWEGRAWPS